MYTLVRHPDSSRIQSYLIFYNGVEIAGMDTLPNDDSIYLEHIMIDPKYQGKSHIRGILAEMKKRWGTVYCLPLNPPLFKHLGFTKVDITDLEERKRVDLPPYHTSYEEDNYFKL